MVYPDLPVSLRREEILSAMEENQIVVVVGETGSGKTTQLPKMGVELRSKRLEVRDPKPDSVGKQESGRSVSGQRTTKGSGSPLNRIGCTQPRRLAATSVAKRVAEEMGVKVGREVGYQVRFNEVCSEDTVVKFMTDGILLAETQGDRDLKQYGVIIIDEAHERSLNIDFLLGYLRRLVESGRRPDLRVVISSATLDAGRFSEFFGGCPVVEVEGRTFPVVDEFLPPYGSSGRLEGGQAGGGGEPLREHVLRGVETVEDEGDILVFLPGEREIRECADLLEGRRLRNTEVVPVFARLSLKEQERVFAPSTMRRIFLATNVAETSLTIPGIVSVIDSGLARVSRFRPAQQVQSLQVEMISQASARQRRGRCGRVREGVCVKLYSEEDLEESAEYTDPEIRRSALSGVILRMMALGLGDVRNFPLIDPPNARAVNEGWKTLLEIGAVSESSKRPDLEGKPDSGRRFAGGASGRSESFYELTEIGWRLSKLAVDPRLGRMLLEAEARGVLEEVSIIVGALSVMEVRERPQGKQGTAGSRSLAEKADAAHKRFLDPQSDFGVYLNIWREVMAFKNEKGRFNVNQLRKFCVKQFVNYRRVMEWERLVVELRGSLNKSGRRSSGGKKQDLGGKVESGRADASASGHKSGRADASASGHIYSEVHKSILVGVPKQVGFWDKEKRVYRGVGGTGGGKSGRPSGSASGQRVGSRDFAVFPGSGLFKEQRVPWVLGFELVETTRLWARKVAEIDPQWVEEVVPHLCKRRYHSPKWDEQQGVVFGKEDVVFGGLKVVEGRRVAFARVDPKGAKEVFIREGLLGGRMRGKNEVVKNLLRVKGEIEGAERKLRRVGYLWQEETAYDFFAEKIPDEVNSAKAFYDWLKEEKNAQLAMVSFEDLIWEEGLKTELEGWPDWVEHKGRKWRVKYACGIQNQESRDEDQGSSGRRFTDEGGERSASAYAADDGVLFEVGIEELALFPPELVTWGVRGMWEERVEALIRSLGKDWRRMCQPVGETAAAFVDEWWDWEPEGEMEEKLLLWLRERTGAEFFGGDGFDLGRVPRHLVPKLRVLDERGKVLMVGDNARGMKEALAGEMRSRREFLANEEWAMTGGTFWSFGEVPQMAVTEGGGEIYPALVDEGAEAGTVGMRAFLEAGEAWESHRAGVVRLFLLERGEQARELRRDFPMGVNGRLFLPIAGGGVKSVDPGEKKEEKLDMSALAAMMNQGGKSSSQEREQEPAGEMSGGEVLDDLIRCAADGAFLKVAGDQDWPRDEGEFARRSERARGVWWENAQKLGVMFDEVALVDARVREWMENRRGGRHLGAIVEQFDEQREWLLRSGFSWKGGYARVSRYLRHFHGMEERLKRLKDLPLMKDEEKQDRFFPLWEEWFWRWKETPESVKLWEIGWMLEELRLEIFAPGVPREGVFGKVSAKRIEVALEELS